jgi:hypothetical protein
MKLVSLVIVVSLIRRSSVLRRTRGFILKKQAEGMLGEIAAEAALKNC